MSKYRTQILIMCILCFCTSIIAQKQERNGRDMRMMPPQEGMMPMGIHQFGVNFVTEIPKDKDVVIRDKADSLYSYFVENVSFGKAVKVVFSDNDVQVTGLPEKVQLIKDGAYLTITSVSDEPLAFELSGKTENGSLTFKTDAPIMLLFNNVVLKSQRAEAILTEGNGHVYAVMAAGSINELSDCRNPEMPPMMMGFPPMGMGPGGVFRPGEGMPDFKPGEPPFMHSPQEENPEDYHEQYGIRMKKPQMKKKVKLEGTFACGGPLTISGGGSLMVQSNNKVGIKSKASIMLRPGNMITVRALRGKGVNAKNELYMYGGALNIDCSFSEDKALTCGRNMYITGGHTVIKAAGGEASEGMQSKFLMQIDGGTVEVAAQDDAINSQGDMVINGGVVRAFSLSNDAFDSNCNIIINGGEIFASGTGMPEGGLDCNDELGYRLFVNGGSIVAIGGRHSMPEMQSRQASVIWRLGNVEADKIYSIDNVCSYKSLRAYQMGGASLFFSSPKLKKGSSYSLSIDGEEKEKIESLKSPFVNVGRTGWPF